MGLLLAHSAIVRSTSGMVRNLRSSGPEDARRSLLRVLSFAQWSMPLVRGVGERSSVDIAQSAHSEE